MSKTVVLDDDPTGTQSASGVTVLLRSSAGDLAEALSIADSVYVQTNSRALSEEDAVTLAARIRADIAEAASVLGEHVDIVLRGDSTLRGHVFAETSVFESADSVLLFVPAFPAGGRTTVHGVHMVDVGEGRRVPVGETEYAADPVFPFTSSRLADYVHEKSGRPSVEIPRSSLRPSTIARILRDAPPGSVVVPDAETDDDIRTIADGVRSALAEGVLVVVRTAAPLAAELAGVRSAGLMERPIAAGQQPALIVCGSHTSGATAQLHTVRTSGVPSIVIDTDRALQDPRAEGLRAAREVGQALLSTDLVVLSSQRTRRSEHNTLIHGDTVMSALIHTVSAVLPSVRLVVAKGGITSAEVARQGIGASSAWVLGQLAVGISAWALRDRAGRDLTYVIVPGNVGAPDAIADAVRAALGSDILPTRPQQESDRHQ